MTKLPAGDVPLGTDITLEFLPDNKVAGSTGVNRFTGTVTSDVPGKLHFGPLATTRRAGPPAAMRLEEDFVGAIGLVTGYQVENGHLVLTDGANELMTFRR